MDKEIINRIKHIETFYEQAPPGYVKEEEEKPEDCIPDEDCNKEARDFLANAPSKGLWMPLGKEVKVMQCWRCKQYGHRTGDKECPMFKTGNSAIEKFREEYEDPMYHFVERSKKEENEKKKLWLQQLVDMSTTSESDSDSSPKKKKKAKKQKKKKEKKSKKKNDSDSDSDSPQRSVKKKHKKHSRRDSSSSDSDNKLAQKTRKKSKNSKTEKHDVKKYIESSKTADSDSRRHERKRSNHDDANGDITPKKKHKRKSRH